ncbi:hypothetical protein GJ496_011591, partial [Pomphorhynchus laevis]
MNLRSDFFVKSTFRCHYYSTNASDTNSFCFFHSHLNPVFLDRMSKRKCADDSDDCVDQREMTSKFARGILSARPIDRPSRTQNETLIAELADRRQILQSHDSEESTKCFAEELVCLNKRFVTYCQESVRKDPHCFLFTGFNDYMEHFMGLFATYLAPLADEPMTIMCFQRLRAHCSSKFANVGKFVSQVKDAATSTDSSIQSTIPQNSASQDSLNIERLRSTYDIGRKVAASVSLGTSSAGRRRREVMKAMQQLMHVPSISRASPVVSFAPVLLKNFNFNTSTSTLKENVTTMMDNKMSTMNKKYFKLRQNIEGCRKGVNDSLSNQGSNDISEIVCSSRIWSCSKCKIINHIDCSHCSQCSTSKNQTTSTIQET